DLRRLDALCQRGLLLPREQLATAHLAEIGIEEIAREFRLARRGNLARRPRLGGRGVPIRLGCRRERTVGNGEAILAPERIVSKQTFHFQSHRTTIPLNLAPQPGAST